MLLFQFVSRVTRLISTVLVARARRSDAVQLLILQTVLAFHRAPSGPVMAEHERRTDSHSVKFIISWSRLISFVSVHSIVSQLSHSTHKFATSHTVHILNNNNKRQCYLGYYHMSAYRPEQSTKQHGCPGANSHNCNNLSDTQADDMEANIKARR